MNNRKFISVFKTLLTAAVLLQSGSACKEKYTPKTNYPHTGYLVVDGYIDAGGNLSQFKLSKTTPLDSASINPVAGATVSIEDENGQSSPLYETIAGTYAGYAPNVVAETKIRLHIFTSDAREYFSDYATPHLTPPIDSVSWQEKNNGVQIYVSAHDPQNNTHFYRWHFDETWKYTSKYHSTLLWDETADYHFRYRFPDEDVYTCWSSDVSSDILTGSTENLSSDVLANRPVTFLPYSARSNKLYNRYSINVYLEALSGDEYAWYEKLRKNTENLGSIFDAQPSEMTGNVHSVNDPGEPVIGWVGCRTVTQSRIFIGRGELPSHPPMDDGYSYCHVDTLQFANPTDEATIESVFPSGEYQLAIDFYTKQGQPKPSGIFGSDASCADCRLKGGVTMRPNFWQD